MKRSILAVAAVLALGSVSAYAQTAGVQPSFNDEAGMAPITLTDSQTVNNQFPKSSMNGNGGPTGPATVVVQGNDHLVGQYADANASRGGSVSDAQNGNETSPTLNDSFHYPAY
jgi:hypothetical protein